MVAPTDSPSSPQATLWHWLTPERVFLLLAIPFGLAVLAANPPFQAPDEYDHFFRAVQLSQGQVVGQRQGNTAGGSLPLMIVGVVDTAGIPFHPEKKMSAELFRKKLDPPFTDWSKAPSGFAQFPHTVYYAPVAYIPQAVAIALGKLAHVGPLGLMYLARLAVLAFSLALGWKAIAWMPQYRWSCLLFLLAPMSLYLMGSIASDGLLIGSTFLLVAMATRYAIGSGDPSNPREAMLFLALTSVVATAKPVYFPLACAGALLAWLRLSSWRQRTLFATAFLVVGVLAGYVWTRAVANLYTPGRPDIPLDPVAQSHYIAGHPLRFLGLVVQTLRADYHGIYQWFVGTLGWGDTPMPNWYYTTFTWGLLACLLLESGGATGLSWRKQILLFTAVIATVILIFAAQYMSWNSPGSRQSIEGIEGRYFLPLAPFVVLSIPRLWRFGNPAATAAALGVVLATLGSVVCLVSVITRYYVG